MPEVLAPSAPPATSAAPLEPIRVRAKFFFEGDRKWFIKGVTYGPFAPDAEGHFVGNPEKARKDFVLMQGLGINLLRVYHIPPRWFLDLAREFRLRVLISIPWAEHVEFLNQPKMRRLIENTIRDGVAKNKGHEAIFGYYVGNEIPYAMVRWLGARRVIEFVEKLIRIAREADPRPLYSYASYPPTEYLLPSNVDFVSYNVYLERQRDFEKYLARLQNLAEDKPLIFGEFGLDTIRKPEEEQAAVLSWHLESVVRGGAAGTIFFAWTDEWFTGGSEITDWAFGLVTRDRQPKKAYHALQKYLDGESSMTERVKLDRYPRVSVIVCSYNGGKTLGDCLRSLDEVTYPDFEIVLVDDGSKDDSRQIVTTWLSERQARHPGVVKDDAATAKVSGQHHEAVVEVYSGGGKLPGLIWIIQPNMGLSYARNAGAHAATGEIFAYTDSDCMADPDWLYYMVGTLISGDYVGVGGPNISPPAVNWIQAAVSAAPGGPSHVLLSDVVAEHIPGCNMAFHRAASTPNIGRPATTWTFAGACKPTAASSPSRPARSCGTTAALPSKLSAPSRKATAKRSRCCVSSTSFSSAPRAPRSGRARSTAPRVSRGFSTSPSSITASSATASSSRSIRPRKANWRRISRVSSGSCSPPSSPCLAGRWRRFAWCRCSCSSAPSSWR
jgi:O-antigen biosynthesis protein